MLTRFYLHDAEMFIIGHLRPLQVRLHGGVHLSLRDMLFKAGVTILASSVPQNLSLCLGLGQCRVTRDLDVHMR